MSLRSKVATLRHNPALCVALFIPLLSILVASTLLTFSIGAQRHTAENAKAAIRIDLPLPPMSKTSWREPLGERELHGLSDPGVSAPQQSPSDAAP